MVPVHRGHDEPAGTQPAASSGSRTVLQPLARYSVALVFSFCHLCLSLTATGVCAFTPAGLLLLLHAHVPLRMRMQSVCVLYLLDRSPTPLCVVLCV